MIPFQFNPGPMILGGLGILAIPFVSFLVVARILSKLEKQKGSRLFLSLAFIYLATVVILFFY